jgi:multiple sugar transport system permease protein
MLLPNSEPLYIGLRNYERLFLNSAFISSIGITLTFVLISVFFEFFLGFALALFITSKIKGVGWIRTSILLPLMMPPVVAGVLWRTIYHYKYGPLNYFMNQVGLQSQAWIGDPKQSLLSVIFVEIWQQTPIVIFILAAGIQSLPTEIFKAAKIDGAKPFKILFELTLPLLKPVIIVVLLIRIMDAFRIFDVIYTLTFGGPGRTTEVMSLLIYKTGLQFFQIGKASAMSWMFLTFILIISFFLIKQLQNKK